MPTAQHSEEPAEANRHTGWFLYLIECVDGSIYTGITTDVAARYAAHAAGKGARYTRSHPPAQLLASMAFPDRSSAAKAEYQVKQLSAAEKRRLASQFSENRQASQTNPVVTAPDSCV